MLRVIGCITDQHDPRLVVLAALICVLGSYTALSLEARARASASAARLSWLCAAAFVTGGGVWSTHFVAELAFKPGLPISYDPSFTALSAVVAILTSGLGLWVALCRGRNNAMLGGAIVGVGIAAMHYTGMIALRLPAIAHWDFRYVLASIIMSTGFSAFALMETHRRPGFIGELRATGLLVIAIVGLHFTGMTAISFMPDPTIIVPEQSISPEWLAISIAAITFLIAGLGLVGSIVDQHLAERSSDEAERLRQHVQALEAAKRDLSSALEAAAAASRAKSLFLATMNHELRTPLNAIIGFSDLLSLEAFGPIQNDRYRAYHRDILQSATHLLSLINDVLDVTKLDAGGFSLHEEAIDLTETISECVRFMEPAALKSNVRLSVSCDEHIPKIRADRKRMRQILLNLLSNAVKFTPAGGRVSAVAGLNSQSISISISDTGIGISDKDIPIALERFGQIDSKLARKYDGAGLGLPLAKHLSELHGGTLTIKSKVNVGTTVIVSLPLDRLLKNQAAA